MIVTNGRSPSRIVVGKIAGRGLAGFRTTCGCDGPGDGACAVEKLKTEGNGDLVMPFLDSAERARKGLFGETVVSIRMGI